MGKASLYHVIRSTSRAAGLAMWMGAAMMTISASTALAHAEHGHPAAIHDGSCEQLGRLAYRLNGVGGSVDVASAPVATPTAVNPDGSYQIMLSDTTIDAPLSDLLASDHAVMVYESDEEMTAIACGNLGGAMLGDRLVTGLAEMGIPGHIGFATFTADGDATDVEVILGHGLAPVSSSGMADDHGHADNDSDMDIDEQEHAGNGTDDHATPSP